MDKKIEIGAKVQVEDQWGTWTVSDIFHNPLADMDLYRVYTQAGDVVFTSPEKLTLVEA